MSTRKHHISIIAAVLLIAGVVKWQAAGAHFAAPLLHQATVDKEDEPAQPAKLRQAQTDHIPDDLNNWNIWGNISGDDISMLSATDGWIADYEGKNSHVYHWDGATWNAAESVAHPDYEIAGGDIQMVSSSDGWLMFWGDYFGPPYEPPESLIYRWDGLTWDYKDTLGGDGSGVALSAMDILSSNDIWAVAGTMFGTQFYHLNGVNWDLMDYLCCDIADFSDIEMVSPTDGWAVGISGSGSGIAHWDGYSWTEFPGSSTSVYTAISMLSDSNGWIVGRDGVILHRENNAWSDMTSPVTTNLNSLTMLSATDGWAVGDGGVILHWDGNNWSQIPSPTSSNLKEIGMVSADEGWIVGDGVVLHYESSNPSLTSNYQTGQPGSYFNISGSNFPADSPVGLSINGVEMSSTVSSDASGGFTFTLSSQQADAGRYEVTATVNSEATTNFTLDPSQPLREKEGDWTVIDIPGGIANTGILLPLIQK